MLASAKSLAAALLAISAVALASVPSAPSSATTRGKWFPSHLSSIGDSTQVITVVTPSMGSDHGNLHAWQKINGQWRSFKPRAFAWVGRNGLAPADQRLQNTGTTPAGTFSLVSAFGNARNPGTKMHYLRVTSSTNWPYDPNNPSTYNVLQTVNSSQWRSDWNEHLQSIWRQYALAVVLDYNLPTGPIRTLPNGVRVTDEPANTAKGGGIFLHVAGDSPSSGCITVKKPLMRAILRWLDPAQHPVIVIEPQDATP